MSGAAKTTTKPKLDIDRTREQLMALGCSHAADQLGDILDGAVAKEVAPHVFLDQLLDIELAGREEPRIRTALKLSKLPPGRTLENFDCAFQPVIERSRIETLATCAGVRGNETVLLQGPPGVGKTHLAVSLGVKTVQLGFSVQYYRFDELMTALRTDAELPPNWLKRRKYMSKALLIIDGKPPAAPPVRAGRRTAPKPCAEKKPAGSSGWSHTGMGVGPSRSRPTKVSATGPSCSPVTRSWRLRSSIGCCGDLMS
ncbi:MAG: ATP-binding protein [Pseudomonadota bacterium]